MRDLDILRPSSTSTSGIDNLRKLAMHVRQLPDAPGTFVETAEGRDTLAVVPLDAVLALLGLTEKAPTPEARDAQEVENFRRALASNACPYCARPMSVRREAAPVPLVEPATVHRDKNGYWTHPLFANADVETPREWQIWLAAHQLTACLKYLEYETCASAIADRYFEGGDANVSDWNPTPPGPEWFLLSLHDTQNGPVAAFVRQEQAADPPEYVTNSPASSLSLRGEADSEFSEAVWQSIAASTRRLLPHE
ncbi:hypothetical protein F6X40_09995 [Paraburkholderia sp. UCT31]|uniref:hypothetical protein n=1 Tax=Paraburkholderia sp. UCT31 TaxID=2615209 RepID=UPI001655D2BF|nr:hypothetical protein [Paraburkholderia sp. UCT31]MBC8737138.1 hypothetical protein [Paraburkholderia sp. UCT31]